MKEQHVDVRCVIHPRRRAQLDPAYRAHINHEIYFFSTQDAKRAFHRDPLRYCGWLTDPVSRVRFRPADGRSRFVYRGRPFYFATDSTRLAFKAMPDSFAIRKGM